MTTDREMLELADRNGYFDATRHKSGEVVKAFCCNSCTEYGYDMLCPEPEKKTNGMCDMCGHINAGRFYACRVGDWLNVRPIRQQIAITRAAAEIGMKM
jgi:hypothetical protein